jgi:UDP-sulfoquinovose synthase
MKVLILGSDGYLGYPLTLHLLKLGHEVMGLDDYSRRKRVKELGSSSLTPIAQPHARRTYLRKFNNYIGSVEFTLGSTPYSFISSILDEFRPGTVVHLAEQPSAPYSMVSARKAKETQLYNVMGTLDLLWAIYESDPEIHLVKLGTMGEYGTPNCHIPEGEIPMQCLGSNKLEHYPCPMSNLLFPRQPGSFYHLSKVHDTYNIDFACRNWGLRSTDIMQGVVYGVKLDQSNNEEMELTRFDYDECFGTVINRFCVQAIIGHPLTVYGEGGQTRGFLHLHESIKCMTLAIENPPSKGEYRTFNQFGLTYSINDLAEIVRDAASDACLITRIDNVPNPRKELEYHTYSTTNEGLKNLGYEPDFDIQGNVKDLIYNLSPYYSRVNHEVIPPTTQWR